MRFLVCGINHKTASVDVREQVAFDDEQAKLLISDLLMVSNIHQAFVLSTCNRTEVYVDAHAVDSVIELLRKHSRIDEDTLNKHLYTFRDEAALHHLVRVATGLDSMVLGEAQILAQFKHALTLSQHVNGLGKSFNIITQKVLASAKDIRTTTKIGLCPVSIASVAVQKALEVCPNFETANTLLIGAGNINHLLAKYLHRFSEQTCYVATRSHARGQTLAKQLNGQAVQLSEIEHLMTTVDVVFTATSSQLPVLGKGLLERVMLERKHRPLVLFDLAIPRDVEPEIAALPGVCLLTLDDLRSVAEHHLNAREHAAEKATQLLSEKSSVIWHELHQESLLNVICAFREQIEILRDQELAKALASLEQGVLPEEAVKRLAHGLTQKWLHEPSVQLKQTTSTQEQRKLFESVKQLFSIKPSGSVDESITH